MKRWPLSILAMTLTLPLSLGLLGCNGNQAPHGSPVLLKVYWAMATAQCRDANNSPTNQCVAWSRDDDSTKLATVPPAPTQFNLVFDRVMDGGKIEDTVVVNGVSRQQPKPQPPVTVTWPDMAAAVSDPPFSIGIWYNSVHLAVAAAGTAYVYGREVPAYPSNTPLTIALDKTKLTSQYGDPMDGPETISVITDEFRLETAPPERVPTNYWLPLRFNNQVGDPTTVVEPHVHVVTSEGGAAAFKLAREPMDPTLIYLQPVDHGGIWPNGTRVDVTVDATLPDIFGAPLGAATTVSFTSCEPTAAGDGGVPCVLGGDAGAGAGAEAGAEADAAVD
jgi:hypothetical protein